MCGLYLFFFSSAPSVNCTRETHQVPIIAEKRFITHLSFILLLFSYVPQILKMENLWGIGFKFPQDLQLVGLGAHIEIARELHDLIKCICDIPADGFCYNRADG